MCCRNNEPQKRKLLLFFSVYDLIEFFYLVWAKDNCFKQVRHSHSPRAIANRWQATPDSDPWDSEGDIFYCKILDGSNVRRCSTTFS